MTLIVSLVVGNWAFHASDRLITVDPTPDNPTGEYDPHSNKTVVVVGNDSWVVLGYTGLAFLDGIPTDQLIAQAISGYNELPPAMMTPWYQPDLHYREIRDRVENALRDAYTRLPASVKKRPTIVLASGIQRRDKIISKVMFKTTVVGDTAKSIEMRPDTQQFKSFYIDAVGMVNNEIIDRAKARLTALDCTSEEEMQSRTRDILRDAVLETSTLTNKVGNNVMTVVLDKPTETIRSGLYITDRKRQAELFAEARQKQPDLADEFAERLTVSTPYVMIPGSIWGPSIGTPGGWDTGDITFDFTGFDGQPGSGGDGDDGGDGGSGGIFFGSHPRRDGP